MVRKHIDCRGSPVAQGCTVAIAADSEEELEDAVVQHVIAVHGGEDTEELRRRIREGAEPVPERAPVV